MKCPECGSQALDSESIDFIYMVVDVKCLECGIIFKLRIEDEPFDIEKDDGVERQ